MPLAVASPGSVVAHDQTHRQTEHLQSGPTVDALRAPPAAADANASRVASVAREHTAVATGDTLVVELSADGLAEAVADADGESVDARFRSLLASEGAALTARQTAATVPDGGTADALALGDGTRVVHGSGDTYYLLADTAALAAANDTDGDALPDGSTHGVSPGQEYRFRFAYDGSAATTTMNVSAPRADFGPTGTDGVLYREPTDQLTLNGTTTLAPGQTVEMEVRNASTGELRQQVEVRVLPGEDGAVLGATLDTSTFGDDANRTLELQPGDDRLDGGPQYLQFAGYEASLAIASTDTEGEYGNVVANASLERGGFVALHVGGPDGERVATSRYRPGGDHQARVVFSTLPEGSVGEDGEVTFALVAHRDVDADGTFDEGQDVRYEDASASTTVSYEIQQDTPTATPTPTPTATATPTPTATSTPTPTPTMAGTPTPTDGNGGDGDGSSDGGGLPGFGLTAALVALVAAALLALRRR